MKQAANSFDVIIVGGGMVGASLALLLEPAIRRGLSVALIDQFDLTAAQLQQPSFDDRSSALSQGSERILSKLGVWQQLSETSPICHIQVSQQGQFGRVRLHSQEYNLDALGSVVENRVLGRALAQQLTQLKQQTGNVQLLAPAQVSKVAANEQGYAVTLQHGEQEKTLQAGLLIAADGANSLICQQLGITQHATSYQQDAIVANVAMDKPHEQWAYERFTRSGPLALLPMSQQRFALVWCMPPELSERRMALTDIEFMAELQQQIGFDKGALQQVGKRQIYPLQKVQAQEQVRHGLVVLGNAAHALHPVAGQGFNLALRDAAQLAQQINTCWPSSVSDLQTLQSYAKAQSQDQWLTIQASHWLPTGFAPTQLSVLRAIGLTMLDTMPVAKKLFARQAMGLVGKAQPWQPNKYLE